MVKSEIVLMSLVNKLSPFISCMMYYFNQVGEVTITKDDTLFLRGKGQEKAITDRVDSIRFDHSCIYYQFASIIGKNKIIDRLLEGKSSTLYRCVLSSNLWFKNTFC